MMDVSQASHDKNRLTCSKAASVVPEAIALSGCADK
jgi:hypothetical protein